MKPARYTQIANSSRSRQADSASWRWEILHRRCLRETSRILRRPEDAEEAAQEALERAWRQRHQCRGAAGAWVAQIARREALRILAHQRRQPATTVADPGENPRGHGDGDDVDRVDRTLDRVAFDQALLTLAPSDRALVLLRYHADLSQTSLAAALDLPEATVRVRLHRIRKRMARVIRGEETGQ